MMELRRLTSLRWVPLRSNLHIFRAGGGVTPHWCLPPAIPFGPRSRWRPGTRRDLFRRGDLDYLYTVFYSVYFSLCVLFFFFLFFFDEM